MADPVIVVDPPRNSTGRSELDAVALALAPVVVDGVRRIPGVRVVESGTVTPTLTVRSRLIIWNGAPELALTASDTTSHAIVWTGFAAGRGAVLIDGATEAAAPLIAANIERLGLRLSEVKLLLSTHEHADHAGGLAELKRRTGAAMVANSAARVSLTTGTMAMDDPQRKGDRSDFHGVAIDQTIRDGEIIQLGTLRLTAHSTPGHSPGGTTWTWRSCEGADCRNIVYADSLSAVSVDGYRFTDHPARVAALRASFATVSRLRCDLVVTPHPSASNLYARLAGQAPLVDPTGCGRLAAASSVQLDERLRSEREGLASRSPTGGH